MKIELRRFVHMPRLSEETPCFTCDILVDGKKVGTASNHGQGGDTELDPPSVYAVLNAHAKTLPPVELFHGTMMQPNATWLIDELVYNTIEEKAKAKVAKKFLKDLTVRVFTRKADGRIYQTKVLTPERVAALLTNPRYRAEVTAKGETFLNDLPQDEALAVILAANGFKSTPATV